MCTPSTVKVPDLAPTATAEVDASVVVDASTATVSTVDAAASATESTSASAPATATPTPYRGNIPSDCAALERAIDAALADVSCTADGECGNFAKACTCSSPVNVREVPKLEAMSEAFWKKNCIAKGPPRACATCTAPPPRHCVGGKCR